MTKCNLAVYACEVPAKPDTSVPDRLSGDERRTALLDIARQIVNEAGPSAVNMGVVAERAEVTRALVYKHFENKDDLLVELYRREAKALDRQIRQQVEAAPEGFEPKVRAFIGACLDAVGEHSRFFTPLRGVGSNKSARQDQRRWDRRTAGYFVSLAAKEFALDERTAASAVGVLFSGVQSLLSQMRRSPSEAQRRFLEDTYVEMTVGALTRLAELRVQPGGRP